MISDEIKIALLEQITAELYSAQLYRALGYEFRYKNLPGFGRWFAAQSHEEVHHAEKIANHLCDRGVLIELEEIGAPSTPWSSPVDAFELVKKHERMISERIKNIASMARKEADFAAESLALWFVKEQIEEEATAEKIYQRLKMVGNDGAGIVFMDKELGRR
jgi:ferritin